MVDPDKAKEKFEKMATSITASTGEEEEKEGACESASVAQALEALKESDVQGKFMPSNPQYKGVGAVKDKSQVQKPDSITVVSPIGSKLNKDDVKKIGDFAKKDVPYQDSKGGHTLELTKKGDVRNLTKITRGEKQTQMNSYDPLANKGILEVSEKLLKKNFNLGEEGYDIARDEGRVKPSKDKKDGTSYPPSEEMKKTQKVNKGPSALEIVKKKYKGQIMDVDKKKKDKK